MQLQIVKKSYNYQNFLPMKVTWRVIEQINSFWLAGMWADN